MGNIAVNIRVEMTVTPLDATTIANAMAWAKANVSDKLPAGASATITYQIVP